MRTAIVGGGATGFFLAVNLKEMTPSMDVVILERSRQVLAKVLLSGGGRCNCTNTFRDVRDLSSVYPRGHRLLKRLFKLFDQHSAYQWFEGHGVPLTIQDDQCVFPAAQDAHAIVNCFLSEARRQGIEIQTSVKVNSLDQLKDYDYVCVTFGGQPQTSGFSWLEGHAIEPPVPSLFTLSIDDKDLCSLMGTVVEPVTISIPSTKLRADGPLLVTHWGVSGPAVLKLSSYAARYLADCQYRSSISINWVHSSDDDVRQTLRRICCEQPNKQLSSVRPYNLPSRLWSFLLEKTLGTRAHSPWGSLNQKETNRLVNTLCHDEYITAGRAPFKDEFVTCGGISLTEINPATLESRHHPHLYFAGEVLDIDGITGGFNFQAAWTTAYTVAKAISQSASLV